MASFRGLLFLPTSLALLAAVFIFFCISSTSRLMINLHQNNDNHLDVIDATTKQMKQISLPEPTRISVLELPNVSAEGDHKATDAMNDDTTEGTRSQLPEEVPTAPKVEEADDAPDTSVDNRREDAESQLPEQSLAAPIVEVDDEATDTSDDRREDSNQNQLPEKIPVDEAHDASDRRRAGTENQLPEESSPARTDDEAPNALDDRKEGVRSKEIPEESLAGAIVQVVEEAHDALDNRREETQSQLTEESSDSPIVEVNDEAPNALDNSRKGTQSELPEKSRATPIGNSVDNDNEVYHDNDLFFESYKKMNKSLKIYVYPHSPHDRFANVLLPVTSEPGGNYASESYFKKSLMKSQFITKDPSKADFFFLPFSITGMRNDKRIGVGGMQDYVQDYVSNVRQKYPYWNRTGGADHFYVACHSIGKIAMGKAQEVKNNAIQVVCSSNYFVNGSNNNHLHANHPPAEPMIQISTPKPTASSVLGFDVPNDSAKVKEDDEAPDTSNDRREGTESRLPEGVSTPPIVEVEDEAPHALESSNRREETESRMPEESSVASIVEVDDESPDTLDNRREETQSQLPEESLDTPIGISLNDDNDVYHDSDLFFEHYKEMNRSLKIYVYPHSTSEPFANVLLPVSYEPGGNYASESYFKKALMKSHFVTEDPSDADFFFLPFSITGMRFDKRINVGGIQSFVREYVSGIQQKYPFWNRSGGADHFYVACHSVGKIAMGKAAEVKDNAIQVVCSSNYAADAERLAFYAGARNSRPRKYLVETWQNDSDIFAHAGRLSTPYETEFLRSKFCFHVKGYEVNNARIGDALYHGCVPVILADHYDLPFGDILNWKSFSVVVETRDIPLMKCILKGVGGEEYSRLQKNVEKVSKHFQWHGEPVEYDAFHMVMYELWLRRNYVRVPLS
ncbi:hypothetical protein RHMOL_Rhmol03G0062400 [Rhododendron molle]|uniref:Uncharacterized protein n=1 Tax=Rhododendron molle TaxID=49168 RepID=A0ACC0PC89_RHOML|nr:hypothetical protein RHMOL_Rhmol03G0062400 [Rhododendron molle]